MDGWSKFETGWNPISTHAYSSGDGVLGEARQEALKKQQQQQAAQQQAQAAAQQQAQPVGQPAQPVQVQLPWFQLDVAVHFLLSWYWGGVKKTMQIND